MIPTKTSTGQQVLKDRSVALTQRQRAALILIDGKRSVNEVLSATAAAGVGAEDLEHLFALGLIADNTPTMPAPLRGEIGSTPQERYAAAYPIATRLTAGLGLRGVRLNLAVEAATSYEDLLALSARIRDAVGPEKFAPLAAALRP
jgi:hypothetical protein